MSMIVLGGLVIATFGVMAGAFCRSSVARVTWTIVFAVAWFLMIFDQARDILIGMIFGLGFFLLGLWLGAKMVRNQQADGIATATTDEVHEFILSEFDKHGHCENVWVRDIWLQMSANSQREWVGRHRSEIKKKLEEVSKSQEGDIVLFWQHLELLDRSTNSSEPQHSAQNELPL